MNKKLNKRKFIIVYILYFIINVFVGYNLNYLTNTKKVDSNYEKNVNEKWERWLGSKEKHLKSLETDILKSNHYIKNNKHFYNIKIIKKFDENIESKDIKGLDTNDFHTDVEMELSETIFINRYRMFNDIPRLNENGENKMKYKIFNIVISSPIELKTISIKDKDYRDYTTSNIIDEYKNEINSLTKDDFELIINLNNTEGIILYIIGATFLIFTNMMTYFMVFVIFDINIDNNEYKKQGCDSLCFFIVTNIAIYSSFLIIKLLS